MTADITDTRLTTGPLRSARGATGSARAAVLTILAWVGVYVGLAILMLGLVGVAAFFGFQFVMEAL